jgi:excisionase family DNA binding protein
MPKLLTPQEIAEYLGVKPSTIYQWTHQGFIPHVKLGKIGEIQGAGGAKMAGEAVGGRQSRQNTAHGRCHEQISGRYYHAMKKMHF